MTLSQVAHTRFDRDMFAVHPARYLVLIARDTRNDAGTYSAMFSLRYREVCIHIMPSD